MLLLVFLQTQTHQLDDSNLESQSRESSILRARRKRRLKSGNPAPKKLRTNVLAPMGRMQPPTIMSGKRCSGMTTPLFALVTAANLVRVWITTTAAPMKTPISMPMYGRPLIPSEKLRTSRNTIGYKTNIKYKTS